MFICLLSFLSLLHRLLSVSHGILSNPDESVSGMKQRSSGYVLEGFLHASCKILHFVCDCVHLYNAVKMNSCAIQPADMKA